MKNQKHRDLDKDPKASDIKPTKSTKTKSFGNYPRCQGLHALFVSDCFSLSQLVPGTAVTASFCSSPFLWRTTVEQFQICTFSWKKVFSTTAYSKRNKNQIKLGSNPSPHAQEVSALFITPSPQGYCQNIPRRKSPKNLI